MCAFKTNFRQLSQNARCTAWHFADSYGLRANRRMHDWVPRILAVRSGGAFRGSISSRRIGARLYDGGTGIF